MSHRLTLLGGHSWIAGFVIDVAAADGWLVNTIGRRPGDRIDIVVPDGESLRAAIVNTQPNIVINCIGVKSGSVSSMVSANIDVVRDALAASHDASARFVQVGSAAEYGNPGSPLIDENTQLLAQTDYARTKAIAAAIVCESDADAIVARVFNVAGARPPDGSFLRELVEKVESARDGVVHLDNSDLRRDWVSARLVAKALVRLGRTSSEERVVNVCSGKGVSHGDLASAIAAQMHVDIEVRSGGRPGVPEVVGDPARLVRLTGLNVSASVHDLARDICGGAEAQTERTVL